MKPEQTVMKTKNFFVNFENLLALIAHHFGKISNGLSINNNLKKKVNNIKIIFQTNNEIANHV
jgi:hypothetical protein